MDIVTTAAELRARVAAWRRDGARVGFVPTMGNLHNGHFSLITLCRSAMGGRADRVVASIFVNPTQFGPNEDYARYPRTPAQDQAGLAAHGCDLLFAPAVEEMYPFGIGQSVRVEVPIVSVPLEGEHRPGHFVGVASVVTKLFNLVQPDVAVFGRKDYQQLLVVERLLRDLRLPIEIVGAPIVREANGLAMSSRNQYLSPAERERAGLIHVALLAMQDGVNAGTPFADVERIAVAMLEKARFVTDYAVVRSAQTLLEPEPGQRCGLIALIAAKLGGTRLIDNLPIDENAAVRRLFETNHVSFANPLTNL
ncbi:MAG: pantoate--beta-alanine ligase [Rudaea sp.]|uniref:pantoate--beta-alanine ligase n=1 Tax=Rudaea sp. TaxID=2136325 RepID=UPI0039E2EA91